MRCRNARWRLRSAAISSLSAAGLSSACCKQHVSNDGRGPRARWLEKRAGSARALPEDALLTMRDRSYFATLILRSRAYLPGVSKDGSGRCARRFETRASPLERGGIRFGRDDGPFFFSCPDAALHECCPPSILLCMGLF